jgi:diacylglycerol O-acyltransferase
MDVGFLKQERGNQRPNVGALAIYDPSTAPGGAVRFKAILDFFTQRSARASVFRRRLAHVPMGLDRPYWIEEGTIDVEYHVRHIALPQPGDWRQLMIQIARIQSRAMDLTKPAWEVYIIEGLDNIPDVPRGSFAMYIKLHHSAVDGGAGSALIKMLHSTTAEPERIARHSVTIADREPTTVELLARMVGNRVGQLRTALSLGADLLPLALDQGRKQVEDLLEGRGKEVSELDEGTAKYPPRTRFNRPLSPHRVIEALSISLSDISALRRSVSGITLNDVFMSVCAGAVRRYLQAKGELPEISLNALMPIDTRRAEASADEGNQIGTASVPVYTNVADAGERLQKVHAKTRQIKEANEALGPEVMAKVFEVLPASAVVLAMEKGILPTINFTISNVRGPDMPLYLAGARLQVFVPINMLMNGLGLSLTGFSYNGRLWIAAVADRDQMPDPGFFADCFRDSVADHFALTNKAPAPSGKEHTPPAHKPVARKKTAKKSARPRRRRA